MGRESKVKKFRDCPFCERKDLYMDSKTLKNHTILCKKAKAAGLILGDQAIKIEV